MPKHILIFTDDELFKRVNKQPAHSAKSDRLKEHQTSLFFVTYNNLRRYFLVLCYSLGARGHRKSVSKSYGKVLAHKIDQEKIERLEHRRKDEAKIILLKKRTQ